MKMRLLLLLVLAGCTAKVEHTTSFDLEAVKQHIHEANQVYGERFKN